MVFQEVVLHRERIMEKKRWRSVGQIHEGLLGEYRVRGCPYEDNECVRGWHTKSWPEKGGIPVHDLFVDGAKFLHVSVSIDEVVSGECAIPLIEDRLVSVHPAEQSAILKAIEQWEYEGA